VTFTQDELNAFLAKWTELSQVRSALAGRISRPAVVLRANEVILATRVNVDELNAVIGLHLKPALAGDELRMNVTKVTAGRLPIPLGSVLARLNEPLAPLQRRLPAWQRESRLNSSTGAANQDAIKATYARLLLAAVNGRPIEPIVLIPLDGGRGVPVRLIGLDLADGAITLRGRLLSIEERREFVERLKRD
jgi:hypothetical protein